MIQRLSALSALRPRRRPIAAALQESLQRVAGGQLAKLPVSVRFWDGSVLEGSPRAQSGPAGSAATSPRRDPEGANGQVPEVDVRRPRAFAHLLREPGELGLARAYIDGSLAVKGDLAALLATRGSFRPISLSATDRAQLALAAFKAAGPKILLRPPVPSIEATVSGDRHSIARDRAAVRHHYDLSNDFYRLLLGPTMLYSCAYFTDLDESLEQAQERKLDLICRKLMLHRGERFLDIGCGWGSLVLHAAEHYGVRGRGITLSEPQASLARERAARRGLSDRVEFQVMDYRELPDARFDKIASVGMYEHVGRAELARYVRRVYELLEPGGLMLNHGVARLHSPPPSAKSFLARYIFPDGELHPVGDLVTLMQSTGLEVRDVESLRDHYAPTLRLWLANLRGRQPEAQSLVGADRVRVWDLWLIGSAQAFEAGEISVYQVLAAKPGAASGLPLDRMELLEPSSRVTA